MPFFKGSFENLGETLRTVSLVIGLLVTSATGVGYIYTMLSDQKAMASQLSSVLARVGTLEKDQVQVQVDRNRLITVETGVRDVNRKLDRVLEVLIISNGTKPPEKRF